MAVIENVSTEEGDILRINTNTPIVGLISLSQFVDTTVGESITDYFLKEFRFSVNGGLTFSDWIELTLLNVQNVSITKFDSFVIEYRYTRVGDTPAVDISFEDILVSGVLEDLPYPVYFSLVFSKFFAVNDLNVFGWALNVLEKLYQKGLILPEYIERGENKSNLDDEDFITYWNSITHYFAIIVYFARQFHDFSSNQLLLEQFLKSKDLTLPDDKNSSDILFLYNNHIAEYKKRGTEKIIDQLESGSEIDGELIRLLNHQSFEEFIFALFQNFESGWCLGKSSPLWAGTENIINLQKGYEFTNEVKDLSKYPLVNPSYISLVDEKIQISAVPNAEFSGVDGQLLKLINVDSSQDYEIGFRVSQSIKETTLVFGCRVFDKDNNELIFKNINTEVDSNYFFYQQDLNLTDTQYWVRGCLFHSSILDNTQVEQEKFDNATKITSLGVGDNLVLPLTSAKIIPIIGVIGNGSGNITLIDSIVVRPRKLNFSRGQLGIHNLIYLMCPNNNTSLDIGKIERFIKDNLIPYNVFLKTNLL